MNNLKEAADFHAQGRNNIEMNSTQKVKTRFQLKVESAVSYHTFKLLINTMTLKIFKLILKFVHI